ncbi:hypothetical protein [Actinacidiphila glaucinigra]
MRGIGSAGFLADVGHEVPTALLPSLLTSTLGAPAAPLGAIEGASHALAGATRFCGGVLADDPSRRRKATVGGYATTAVLGTATAGATAVWQVGLLGRGSSCGARFREQLCQAPFEHPVGQAGGTSPMVPAMATAWR